MPEPVGERELQILDQLQEDARLTNQELAERVNLSASACWRRVRALEETGVIKGYRAEIDPERLGLRDSVLAHVKLEKHTGDTREGFVRAVRLRPEILECYATTGDEDYVLRVLVPDVRAYNKFLEEFLFDLPYVAQVRSHFILQTIKAGGRVPTEVLRRGG